MLAQKICSISLIALLLGISACTKNQNADTAIELPEVLTVAERNNRQISSNLSGEVKVDGSSTVFPVSQAMAAEFQKVHPNIKVSVASSGTGSGFKILMLKLASLHREQVAGLKSFVLAKMTSQMLLAQSMQLKWSYAEKTTSNIQSCLLLLMVFQW